MKQWQPRFVGRETEISQMCADWEKVRQGQPILHLILGETGLGKTRLVQEFYQEISTDPAQDPEHYWPENLGGDNNSLKVNPDFSEQLIEGKQIPWLWWGVRFRNPDRRNPSQTLGCQIHQDAHALAPHLYSLQQYKQHKLRNQTLVKEGLLATSALLGLGVFGAVVDSLVNALPSLADNLTSAFDSVDKNKLRTGGDLQQQQQIDVLETLYEYINSLFNAKIPVVLFLDDAQWADADSLFFLQRLYQQAMLIKAPLYVIATHWHKEWAQAQYHQQADSLAVLCQTLQLSFAQPELATLTQTESLSLIQQALTGLTPAQQQAIYQRTQGNAGFLHDLIQHLLSDEELFVHDNPRLALSDDGEVELTKVLAFNHYQLHEHRYKQLTPELKKLLNWSSYQGLVFFENIVLKVAAVLEPKANNSKWFDQANQHYAFIKRWKNQIQSEFRHPALQQVALDNLTRKKSKFKEFKKTLREILHKDYKNERWKKWNLESQIQYLRLLQQELKGLLPEYHDSILIDLAKTLKNDASNKLKQGNIKAVSSLRKEQLEVFNSLNHQYEKTIIKKNITNLIIPKIEIK